METHVLNIPKPWGIGVAYFHTNSIHATGPVQRWLSRNLMHRLHTCDLHCVVSSRGTVLGIYLGLTSGRHVLHGQYIYVIICVYIYYTGLSIYSIWILPSTRDLGHIAEEWVNEKLRIWIASRGWIRQCIKHDILSLCTTNSPRGWKRWIVQHQTNMTVYDSMVAANSMYRA